MDEVNMCIMECSKLKLAFGIQLHRDPMLGKVKILPLGHWRKSLTQEDIPHAFIRLTDQLDCVGVKLASNYLAMRKINSCLLVEKVTKIINPWKAGQFMALVDRTHTINSKVLSKIWYIAGSIYPRDSDIKAITKSMKSWLYQDLLVRLSDQALYRLTAL